MPRPRPAPPVPHRVLAALALLLLGARMEAVAQGSQAAQASPAAVTADDPRGAALVERLRRGGLVLFVRHADTTGMACDRSYRIGDRAGQRNLSEPGRDQARRIGEALRRLAVPVATPVLAGPVFRARDTAELAFGPDRVAVTDGLTADDYAGARLPELLEAHRALFTQAPPAGANRVLVGHRTPAILVLGSGIGGDAFPEGAALVLEPRRPLPDLLGILVLAPVPGRGFHGCR